MTRWPNTLDVTVKRHFPPWTVEDHNGACFIVKDRNGSFVLVRFTLYRDYRVGNSVPLQLFL
jgi:hypothetical protein